MRYAILLGAVALGIAGYSIFWFVAADRAEDSFADWAAQANAQGFDVAYEDVAVKGYPFRLITRIGHLQWGAPTADGMVHWESRNLEIAAEPWRQGHVIIRFDGPQNVIVPDGGGTDRYSITASRARASLVTPPRDLPRLAFAAEELDVLHEGTGQRVTADVAQMYLRQLAAKTDAADTGEETGEDEDEGEGHDPSLPETAQLDFRFEDVQLPEGEGGTLGRDIGRLQGETVLHGQLTGPGAEQLRTWAQAGGTMDISGLSVQWGDFTMEAAGTVTLDDEIRPLGAFEARFQGLEDALTALANLDGTPEDTMRLARTILRAIEDREDGAWLTVPFTMRGGYLYMGTLPLVTLSPIGE